MFRFAVIILSLAMASLALGCGVEGFDGLDARKADPVRVVAAKKQPAPKPARWWPRTR